jgi:DNA invertase Pin-like site-specific DNA recombinase
MAKDYAQRVGLELDDTLNLHDDGVSAFHGLNATADNKLGAFLELVRAGDIPRGSLLIVERLDRLSRQNPLDATEVVRDILKAGITVVPLSSGKEYSWASLRNNQMLWLELQFELMQAHLESAKKSDRLKYAWAAKRDQARKTGKPLTRVCPPWLRWSESEARWEILEPQAKIVRRIFSETLRGRGQHVIARDLNQEGVRPFGRDGKYWRRPYVRGLLANPSVVGNYTPTTTYHDEFTQVRKRVAQEAIKGYFPAIIKRTDFTRVQELLTDHGAPLRGKHAGGSVVNILGRLARCGDCGAPLVLVNKGRRYLVCEAARVGKGCRYRSLRLDAVEGRLLEDAGWLIGDAPAGSRHVEIDRDIRNLDAALLAMGELLEKLRKELHGAFSTTLFAEIRALEANREDALQKLADLHALSEQSSGRVVRSKLADLKRVLTSPQFDRTHANALLRQLFSTVRMEWSSGGVVLCCFEWKQGGESVVPVAWYVERVRKRDQTPATRKSR